MYVQELSIKDYLTCGNFDESKMRIYSRNWKDGSAKHTFITRIRNIQN